MRYVIQILILCGLGLLTLLLQLKYWYGEGGRQQTQAIELSLIEQNEKNAEIRAKNALIRADIDDLKHGFTTIEERARLDLGLIKADETFVQFVPIEQTPPADASTQ